LQNRVEWKSIYHSKTKGLRMEKKWWNGVVFEQDIYLAKESEARARMKIAEKAKQIGFLRFGGEFLFMKSNDVQDLEKQEELAREIFKQHENLFDETYFSIHCPWIPTDSTSIETSLEALQTLEKLLSFAPDLVSVINLHFGIVPLDRKSVFDSFEKKKEVLETLGGVLNDLNHNDQRICVETILMPSDLPDSFFYSGMLPSDFKFLTKNKNVGVTIDTCHAGISQENCREMLQKNALCEGLEKKDLDEVNALAKDPIEAYLSLGNKIWHVHYSDYKNRPGQKPLHGPPFPDGERNENDLWKDLERIRKATDKKKLGATLEIVETDYLTCSNMWQSLQWIARQGGSK